MSPLKDACLENIVSMEEPEWKFKDTPMKKRLAPVRPPLLWMGSSPLSAGASPTEMKMTSSTTEASFRTKSPRSGTIQQAGSPVQHILGSADNAEKFRDLEINGEALVLLTVGHLIRFMNIKLGHALKICETTNELRKQQQCGPDSAHYHLCPRFVFLQCSHSWFCESDFPSEFHAFYFYLLADYWAL